MMPDIIPVFNSDSMSNTKQTSRKRTKDLGFLPIPTRLQYDLEEPRKFTALLNYSFGIATTFVVMNLYYNQPILIQLSKSFGVSYQEVSRIPTLVQAGYACGLLLIAPLGDLVPRRPLLLLLVFLSTSLTIGLAVTHSLVVFEALSFLVGTLSVVPQIFIPFAADLAPENQRASAISIVFSGLLLGVLLARVLAGIIAQFASWQIIYYMAVGLQASTLLVLYAILPYYPAKNADRGLTYLGIMKSMARLAVTEPTLVQASLVLFASSAAFANFWVTLTFLLGSPPYNYSTLVIGLFGLVGMIGVVTGPLIGRLIDRLVPWHAALIATAIQLIFQAIQTGAGGISIAAVIIMCFGLDVGNSMQQVALVTYVYDVDKTARSRLNAIMIISIFLGMVMGTSVGTQIFVKYGWRAASGLSMGLFGFQFFILLLRGPHVKRHSWFGYEGGMGTRNKKERGAELDVESDTHVVEEKG